MSEAQSSFSFSFTRENKTLPSDVLQQTKVKKNYIIVGAGMAGLSAAFQIKYLDPNASVTIIEGGSTAGGRIRTYSGLSEKRNKCAAWIHDPWGGNHITHLAKTFGLKMYLYDSHDDSQYGKKYVMFDTTNPKTAQTPLTKEEYDKIYEDYDSILYNYDENGFNPFNEYINAVYKSQLQGKDVSAFSPFDLYQKEIGPIPYRALWVAKYYTEPNGAYADKLSFHDQHLSYDPRYEITIPSTFQFHSETFGEDYYLHDFAKIPQEMAKRLDAMDGVNIHYNTYVSKVQSTNKGTKIFTSKGTYEGDYSIVTVSSNVLKKGHITFTPDMPNTHKQALSQINMGHYSKVMIEFDNPIQSDLFKKIETFDHLDKKTLENGSCPFSYLNFYPVEGKPIIVAIANGGSGEKLDKILQEKGRIEGTKIIQEMVVKDLKKMFGNDTIPNVKKAFVTSPGSYKLFEGAWSYLTNHGTNKHRYDLGQPFDKTIIAGEATNPVHGGTSTGATESGEYAATHAVTKTHNLPQKTFFVKNAVLEANLETKITEEQLSKTKTIGKIFVAKDVELKGKIDNYYNCEFKISKGYISYEIDKTVPAEITAVFTFENGQKLKLIKDPSYVHYTEDGREVDILGRWEIEQKLINNKANDWVKVKTIFDFQEHESKVTQIASLPTALNFIK